LALSIIDLRGREERLAPRHMALDLDVVVRVRDVVSRVRAEGDAALLDLTLRYDGADLTATGLTVSSEEVEQAMRIVSPELSSAIDSMIERLRALHERQVPVEWWTERDGLRSGELVRPLARVGCYVPGGRAAYPSTVVMTVVPGRVAGVEEVVVCTPPMPDGSLPPAVLVAAARAGADLVVKAGGAQAVAALAYGTETVPAVDKIVGPGNVYVTAAKREVAGDVGIDSLAGPSELVIVAGDNIEPELIAADLVAQAEHDPLASTDLVTTSRELVDEVGRVLKKDTVRAARRDVVERSIEHARAVLVEDTERAADVVNDLAPEHLQVMLNDPRAFIALVRNAGAIFLGPFSAVPFGAYGAGANHVLPRVGTAGFAAGRGASDFVTVSAVVELDGGAAARLGPEIATMARAEGLDGHARAVELRTGGGSGA